MILYTTSPGTYFLLFCALFTCGLVFFLAFGSFKNKKEVQEAIDRFNRKQEEEKAKLAGSPESGSVPDETSTAQKSPAHIGFKDQKIYRMKVVGMAHRGIENEFTCRAELRSEPDNEYDDEAVAVYSELGTQIGYISKDSITKSDIFEQLEDGKKIVGYCKGFKASFFGEEPRLYADFFYQP